MSERGLVVRQGSLVEIENALATATTDIAAHLNQMLDTVNSQTPHWTEETPSRVAQRQFEQRVRDSVDRLGAALEQVKTAVATHRELAHDIEVKNVAIVG